VKNSKIHTLTSKFKEIRMKDDEMFDENYAQLNDILNSYFNLGKRFMKIELSGKS
jgi:hypothetical protein